MIISIGEIVWDMFPHGRVLGGAPLNVAYHLSALKEEIRLVSRIGSDELGRETLSRITELGLPVGDIQQDSCYPTGRVRISIDDDNEPSFDIVKPAAWDFIEDVGGSLSGRSPFHLVFGSLAQRCPQSRQAIRTLWPLSTLCFYDVNLRPPHTGKEIVLDSLEASDVVKVNDSELATISSWFSRPERQTVEQGRHLVDLFGLEALAVSLGSRGSILVTEGGVWEHPGFEVQVSDTVGSGDAFFADLIHSIVRGRPWQQCLESANRRGAYVAGKNGATPPVPEKIELQGE